MDLNLSGFIVVVISHEKLKYEAASNEAKWWNNFLSKKGLGNILKSAEKRKV